MISTSDKERINELPIVDVIGTVVELKKEGVEFVGFSPFQTEKSKSFKVNPVKNVWKCFSSGKGGKGAVSFFIELEQLSWYDAMLRVAKIMNINLEGVETKTFKPDFSKRSLKEDEQPGTKSFVYKDFTPEELKILGPRVNELHCQQYNLHSVEVMTICKENEAFEIRSTPDYPIFAFDFGDWQKIYQPRAENKAQRFSYAGVKPARFVFGMNVIEKIYKDNKAIMQAEDYAGKNTDPKLEECFIMSGGSDALNLRSFEKYPIWHNSEQEHLEWDDYRKLTTWVKNIYYIGDLDVTGKKQAIQLGLKYLDIKLVWLPNVLTTYRDERGNLCKDFKNYVQKFYNAERSKSFANTLDKLIENSMPLQFWNEYFNNKKTEYYISNTRLYHFLSLLGFGRYEHENLKEGYIYIRKEGSIVRVLEPYQIANFVHNFLEERQMSTNLRDYVYKTPALSEKSLANLPKLSIDFTVADKNSQYFFFQDKVWKITKDSVQEYRQGEVDRFIWEDKIIDFNPKLQAEPFRIFKDVHGDLDIEVIQKDNMFFNYLINTSRIHWRKELEDSFDGRAKIEAEEYFKNNRFEIAGENLSDDERLEQKLHLINKIYSIGYMLHQYKNESKAWCVFAMDNKISDQGESHGGSGKSICYSYLNNILKRRVVLKGRDPKLTQNDFIYSSVTEDTDFILIDDAHQYLNFDFFFSEITGSLIVNPKNNNPFEIPFSKAPKFVITSNFTPRDIGPSTARRLLYTVFSDYYHYNKDDFYRQERQVSDDFEGRNLFKDFYDKDWNDYYNFCAYAVRFFLDHPFKVSPPMDNVTKRNLITEMTTSFKDWADVFFITKGKVKDSSEEVFMYQNYFFSKEDAFTDFKNKYQLKNWTPQRFKKAMMAYCQFMGWIFNPIEQGTKDGRIMKKFNGITQEVIYIKTFTDTVQDAEALNEIEIKGIQDAMNFDVNLELPDENTY